MDITLHSILLNLLYLGASAAIAYLAPRVKAFVLSHTTAAQRGLLGEFASAVVPFVERSFPHLAGAMKMQKAVKLVDGWLAAHHVDLSLKEIEAAIEHAYADAKQKGVLGVYSSQKQATPTQAGK